MKRAKRAWTVEEKLAILKEGESNGVVETCRKYDLYKSLYYNWKEKYDSGGEQALKPQYVKRNDKELKRVKRENAKLKQLVAEKELELQMKGELLKKKMQQWKNESK